MNLLNYIFQFGVLFAIFGFVWGFFDLILRFLTAGRTRTLVEDYILKGFKYILLTDVAFRFALKQSDDQVFAVNMYIGGLILLTYFLGKLQAQQNKLAFIKISGSAFQNTPINFKLSWEIGIIFIAIGVFAFFIFNPEWSINALSTWMHDTILNIEDTPIFGFIFKIIGFFFLVSLLFKMFNAIMLLITGQAFSRNGNSIHKDADKNDDAFDDYEELE